MHFRPIPRVLSIVFSIESRLKIKQRNLNQFSESRRTTLNDVSGILNRMPEMDFPVSGKKNK